MKSFTVKEIIFFLLIFAIITVSFFLSHVLLPFYLGLFIAFLLDPCVNWLANKNIKRGIGATVVLIAFFFLISFITFLILPILFSQIISFANEFPEVIDKINIQINLLVYYFKEKITFLPVSEMMKTISPNITKEVINFLQNFVSSTLAAFNIITIILITPIVSWYFLTDWEKMSQSILGIVSKKYKALIIDYSNNINKILASYLRGQLSVCALLSIFYCFCFYYLEINYSLFVAIFAGFFSFIPVFGVIFSFFITSILTYLQFFDISYVVFIAFIFLGGQLLESNFLTPKLIGNRLGLHPLIVILSIFVFGASFGIVGIIFSIPLTSIIMLVIKRNFTSK